MLSILLDRLGFKWGKDLVHFSYGMVELPEGKMKSREGTVVDADDLMDDMVATAKQYQPSSENSMVSATMKWHAFQRWSASERSNISF